MFIMNYLCKFMWQLRLNNDNHFMTNFSKSTVYYHDIFRHKSIRLTIYLNRPWLSWTIDATHLVVVENGILCLPNDRQIKLFIFINRTTTKDLHSVVTKSESIRREISVLIVKINFYFSLSKRWYLWRLSFWKRGGGWVRMLVI